MNFDREKFKAVVHYIIWKAGDHAGFGATKLNKVLWFADARAYTLTGKPITGASYIRQKYGPVPRQIMPARKDLEAAGLIRVWKDKHYDRDITRFQALQPPPQSALTEDERQIVDYWIKHIDEEHTAASISDESHDYAWEIARLGEELPLYAILANRIREPNEKELAKAKHRARKLGLI